VNGREPFGAERKRHTGLLLHGGYRFEERWGRRVETPSLLGAAHKDGFLPSLSIVVNLHLKAIDCLVWIGRAGAEIVEIFLRPMFRGRVVRLAYSPKNVVLNQLFTGLLLSGVASGLRGDCGITKHYHCQKRD
jgi:hypothetical protein